MIIMGYDATLTHVHYTRESAGLRRVGSAAIRGGTVVSPWPVAERRRPETGSKCHRCASMVSRVAGPGSARAQRCRPRGPQAAPGPRRLGAGRTGLAPRRPRDGFATDLWTLPRVATVIARLTGERFQPGHVWYLLRALNWSVQRPARQSRERNEAAVTAWKSTGWRRVKKTPAAGARGSSSKTKAAFPTSP